MEIHSERKIYAYAYVRTQAPRCNRIKTNLELKLPQLNGVKFVFTVRKTKLIVNRAKFFTQQQTWLICFGPYCFPLVSLSHTTCRQLTEMCTSLKHFIQRGGLDSILSTCLQIQSNTSSTRVSQSSLPS